MRRLEPLDALHRGRNLPHPFRGARGTRLRGLAERQ
jgi:hypothetical protein